MDALRQSNRSVIGTIMVLLSLMAVSCSKDDDQVETCGVENPATELPWLAQRIGDLQKIMAPFSSEIIQYDYNGETVYAITLCPECADSMTEVYDCSGNLKCRVGGIAGFNDCPGFFDDVQNAERIY